MPSVPLDAICQPAFLYDPDGRIAAANDLAEGLAGRSLAGLAFAAVIETFDIRSPDGTPLAAADLPAAGALRGEGAVGIPFVVTTADGRTLRIVATAAPVLNGDEVHGALDCWQNVPAEIQAGAVLRESEGRQAFLLRLSDALRPLSDPIEVQAAAARILAEHLDLDRVAYFEVDGDEYVTVRDHTRSVPSVVGRYPLEWFGARLLAVYRSGATAVSEDIEADPGLSREETANYAALRIRAYVAVPLVKAGAFVAGLAVHTVAPRAWTPGEIALVEATAERTWAAVEQAQAEAALRQREQLLRGIFRAAPAGIGIASRGVVESVNDGLCRITGYAPGELVGTSTRFLYPDDETGDAALSEKHAQIRATGVGAVETRWRRKDGAVIDVLLSSSPLDRADPNGTVVTVALEVTDRKRAEAVRRESEERFRSILDRSLDALYRRDLATGRAEYYSPAIEAITGFSVAESMAMGVDEVVARVHPDDLATVTAGKVNLPQGVAEGSVDYRFRCKDGTYRWVSDRFRIVPGEDGRPRYREGIIRDITARKRSEAALARSEAEYRQIVEHAPTGIFEIDYAGPAFRRVNDAMCAILGYTREELLAMDPGALLDDESRGRLGERVRAALAGEPVDESVALRAFTKDGREIRAALNVRPLFADGRPDGALVVAHDITERVKTEEARARLADQRQLALDAAGMGWWRYDPVTRITSYDDRYREIFGVSGASKPNDEILERIHPDDLPGVRAKVEAALDPADPRPYAAEYRILMPGGDVKWIEAKGLATFAGQGRDRRATDLVGTVRDITDERCAEAALWESREQYRALFDSLDEGFCIIEVLFDEAGTPVDYVFLEANPAFVAQTDLADAIGKRMWDLEPAHEEHWFQIYGEIARTGEPRRFVQAAMPLIGGWYEVYAFPSGAPGSNRVAILFTDITERKRAEEALLESSEKYRDLFVHDITGDFIASVDGRILDCNPAFARMFGFSSVEEATGSSIVETYASPGERDALLEQLRTEGQVENDERFRRRRDGTPIHVVENVLGIFDGDGNLVRTQGYIIDDTERHRAEAALQEYAEDLRRSNEDLERFAYVSSHDLQEPLRSIVSFSQLLEKRYRGKLGEDADEYIAFIVEGGNRMQTLILDLLAYSRVNSKAQERRPTDVEAVMAAVERNLDPQLREAGGILSYDPLPTVTADPLQLEQVLSNLVSNAVKFRRPDEPLRVHVSALRTDGSWEFAVSDNGIGIEAEYFDRIFVIFQRLHTKEAYPGTGIGLAIVKRIVDRHGGKVRVESVPGEGSTFFFTLPAA